MTWHLRGDDAAAAHAWSKAAYAGVEIAQYNAGWLLSRGRGCTAADGGAGGAGCRARARRLLEVSDR